VVYDPVLIQIESAAASAAESLRIGVDMIAGLSNREHEHVPVLSPFARLLGIRKAACGLDAPAAGGPNSVRVAAYLPNCDMYCVSAVAMVCTSLITAVSRIFISTARSAGAQEPPVAQFGSSGNKLPRGSHYNKLHASACVAVLFGRRPGGSECL